MSLIKIKLLNISYTKRSLKGFLYKLHAHVNILKKFISRKIVCSSGIYTLLKFPQIYITKECRREWAKHYIFVVMLLYLCNMCVWQKNDLNSVKTRKIYCVITQFLPLYSKWIAYLKTLKLTFICLPCSFPRRKTCKISFLILSSFGGRIREMLVYLFSWLC